MPGKSKIEWTDAVWNPVTGCTQVSAGCDHCYAKTFAERWRGIPGHPYEQGFDLKLWPERLDLPLRWTKSSRIFVNSMSDLFHADVPTDFIDRVFGVMAGANRHIFQILTKRPQRMERYLNDPQTKYRIWNAGRLVQERAASKPVRWKDWYDVVPVAKPGQGPEWCYPAVWPLPNVWLGVSVENQEAAFRLDALVKTPAAVRFVSAEPLIGPLNLGKWIRRPCSHCDGTGYVNFLDGKTAVCMCGLDGDGKERYYSDIDWIIAGGESGPGHRPADVAWFRSLADQCQNAGVPFFMKQDSGARSGHQGRIPDDLWALKQMPEVGK